MEFIDGVKISDLQGIQKLGLHLADVSVCLDCAHLFSTLSLSYLLKKGQLCFIFSSEKTIQFYSIV